MQLIRLKLDATILAGLADLHRLVWPGSLELLARLILGELPADRWTGVDERV